MLSASLDVEVPIGSLSNDDNDGNENGKNFARASRFSVHFVAVVALLQSESAYFQIFSRTGTQNNKFLFLFLNFETILKNSTPKKFANV